MSVHQEGAKWKVRWRENGRNRAKTFASRPAAEDFNLLVNAPFDASMRDRRGQWHLILADGTTTMVDEVDAKALGTLKWRRHSNGYVMRTDSTRRNAVVMLHRQILGLEAGDPLQGDHINGDRNDNRRTNLRVCTQAENMAAMVVRRRAA